MGGGRLPTKDSNFQPMKPLLLTVVLLCCCSSATASPYDKISDAEMDKVIRDLKERESQQQAVDRERARQVRLNKNANPAAGIFVLVLIGGVFLLFRKESK